MQKFNVGDKVKVSKLDNRTWVEVRKRLGQIGTVIKPDPTDCQIEFQDGKRFFFRYCELEKIEEDFKIGEEVYINGHGFINEKVSVCNVSEHSISVKTKNELIYYFDPKFISKQPINTNNQVEKIMNKTPEQIDSEIDNLKAQIAKLEKEKEKENSTFEVGDWFIVFNIKGSFDYLNGHIYEVVDIINDYNTKFLISRFVEKGLNTKNNGVDITNARKATPAEIEAHLIKLAEESGLKIGGRVPDDRYNIEKFKLSKFDEASIGCNKFINVNKLKYCLAIFYNYSNFSTPFDYITYLQNKFQPKITINGYDAEFCEGFVKFGCAKFVNSTFTETKRLIDLVNGFESNGNVQNRHIENIKLGVGVFTPTDIENIIKRLKD